VSSRNILKVSYWHALSFHLFRDHSQSTAQCCVKLDYIGIVILMWGAGIPTIYYGFVCDRHLQLCYWTTVSNRSLLSRVTTNVLQDQWYCLMLHHCLSESAFCSIRVQALAYMLIHSLWAELYGIHATWFRSQWMGDAECTHVIDVDRLDGCS
jgi:predicted membrane channel-forming protein YqfA (hemolysin III family)